MSSEVSKKPVIIVVGPTAVGKTNLAIDLARQINGEIISADSRLFYRGMDIGTAKPTKDQMRKIPHHLINCADPEEIWSLSVFRQEVYRCIEDIQCRDRVPIIVGGTGQYIRALTEGWEMPEQEPNNQIRIVLHQWAEEIGAMELHEKLKICDPQAAENIDPTNVRRTIRALEVIFMTGKRFSELRRKFEPRYDYYVIGLSRPRTELYHRIDQRVEDMFKDGLIEETRGLINRGLRADHPNLSAIGYRETAEVVKGNLTLEEAKQQMKKKTREFVRRQRNWFKPEDERIHWFEMTEETVGKIIHALRIAKIII